MLDGGALGTLIIGLDSAREDSEWSETSARHLAPRSRRPSRIRVRLANVLRFAADRLDHAPSAGLGPSAAA